MSQNSTNKSMSESDDENKSNERKTEDETERDRSEVTESCRENFIEELEGVLNGNGNGEKIKTAKTDVDLLIVNDNNKKLSAEVEENKKEKCDNGSDEEDSIPPALPPRPPPRPRQPCTCTCGLEDEQDQERSERRAHRSCWSSGLRKYVFLCTICGSLSIVLGTLFLTVYFMLKSYTSSLNHFETIPTYVLSGLLIATGFLTICLACRKNRNSFLMKLCGLCSLCGAILCVSVTVTTTVIHMNRLQTLRECLYTQKTQSCTCYSVLLDNDRSSDEGIKFVFNSTPDCEVIHGALYACLRAIFGLSVIGILVCISGCMLVYQLLSHERKKMYWAQLEMRCRYLYRQQRNPHYYSCCDECRFPPHPHELFPWDFMGNRLWSTGRIGNLYTPSPEDRGNQNRLRSGWNWRRLPWSRSGGNSNEPTRANLGSPDSQYGFSSTPTVDGAPYTVLDPRTTGPIPPGPPIMPAPADITEGGFYSWGPPPPYASNRNSANNSPARRSIGDILHQVSPIRRNDNVSPARSMHHVHRHHMHHNRQCSSSSRQATINTQNQLESIQKTTSNRNTPITNAIQQQQAEMNALWSNSLSSVHRFQKVIQNKDNYENMYESENIPSTNGFNTLPSLKKRNQPRVSDIFQNESSHSGYFFSSAENLGGSTSNIEAANRRQNENLPPRVYLTNSQPNSTRYSPTNPSQNYVSKSQTDLETSGTSNQQQLTPIEGSSGNQSLRSTDRNTSIVRKLFVNCSPSKQNPKNVQEPQIYSVEKKENFAPTHRKKISKKMGPPKESGVEASNENTITFRYRVGIPRSPNIQNLSQIIDTSPASLNRLDGVKSESENRQADKSPRGEMSQMESHKIPKSIKYLVKDADLLQKHTSLIKEFNKNIDSHENMKCRSSKTENRKLKGIENEGFQKAEDTSKEMKQHFQRTFHPELRRSPGTYSPGNQEARGPKVSCASNEGEANEDCLGGTVKVNENESDIYFGDISNSSCYMSLQNDGPESLLYEETRSTPAMYSTKGHSLLNKQNLKMIEDENLGYNETMTSYDSHSNSKQNPENSNSNRRHNQEGIYRYRLERSSNHQFRGKSEQSSDGKTDEISYPRPPKQELNVLDGFGKSQRRSFIGGSPYSDLIDKGKYFTPISSRGLQDHYRQPEHHHEALNSNDEQSSSSLTADSGISAGKNFISKCFENAYHELDYRTKENESNRSLDVRSDSSFEALNEKFLAIAKAGGLDTFGDFSHPLFQKPKILPRGNKYKDSESRHRKKVETEDSESAKDVDLENQNKRNRNFVNVSKMKGLDTTEEVSNQLLSTCSLTLSNDSDPFLGEDSHRVESLSKSQENILSAQKDDFEEIPRKSPKPLPRTSVLNKNLAENNTGDHSCVKSSRYSQNKDRINLFLAPDAQYEYQENFNQLESKQKYQQKHSSNASSQNMIRNKPAVPARPLNLQGETKKPGKLENLNIQMIRPSNEPACHMTRRRQNGVEGEDGGKDSVEIGTHSVNV